MVAHVAGVGGEPRGGDVGVVGLRGVEEGRQRHLGVDDDLLAAGDVDHEVGPLDAVAGDRADLGVEVAVLEHAGQLDDPPQLHLAPRAARLRCPERLDEGAGLGLQQLGRLGRELNLLHEAGVRGDARLVGLADRLGDLAEGLADRLDELLDLGRALRELGGLGVLGGLEPLVGEGQERLVVVQERLRGQRLELLGLAALLTAQLLEAQLRRGPLGVERGGSGRGLLLGVGRPQLEGGPLGQDPVALGDGGLALGSDPRGGGPRPATVPDATPAARPTTRSTRLVRSMGLSLPGGADSGRASARPRRGSPGSRVGTALPAGLP